jgi:polar amino acid transport system substrate-binding protein
MKFDEDDPARARKRRRFPAHLLVAAVAVLWLGVAPAQPATGAPFVMGTDHDETTFAGQWMRRVYAEAFRRLELPLRVENYPTKRLTLMLARGAIDGEFARFAAYEAAHPELVRVPQAVFEGEIALFVTNAALHVQRLEDLAAANLRGGFRRGVMLCEEALKRWLPAGRFSDVTTTEEGLRNLIEGPPGFFHCDTEASVKSALYSPSFKQAPPIRKLIVVGGAQPLYPFIHRKHAELAPRLAQVLKAMHAEGLIERHRRDVDRELSGK